MEDSRKYLNPLTLAKIQGLELRARRIVEGYMAGVHRSPYHGFSIEFAEHREYVPGDDLRYVDWKVFGRTDKIYLKQFEEETNLVSYLLLDSSESMHYRGERAALSKLEYAKCIAASLAYLVLQQQDSIGLVTFDSEVRALVRASGQPSHLRQLVHVMEQSTAEKKTSTGPIFHELAERLKKRGIIIILSDLFDDVNSMMTGIKHFRHRRHEVIVFHVIDPDEADFPFRGTTKFQGLEQLPEVVTDPRGLRKAYLNEFNNFVRRVQEGCRDHKVDYVQLRTDQPLDVALSNYLSLRAIRT
ncbi:MAG: DUF58 domain-containing protein [Planctomycetales bacterium]